MKSLLIMLLLSSVPTSSHEAVTIEVDESKHEFRVVVKTDRKIKFDAFQTESPSPGFPAAFAGVLVMNSRGEVVGCQEENLPRHVADSISGSRRPEDRKIVKVTRNRPYLSPWYKSKNLFFGFDSCVLPSRRGGYVKYQIQIEIETSRGLISTKTHWLDINGLGGP
jgi:hypothetical protein